MRKKLCGAVAVLWVLSLTALFAAPPTREELQTAYDSGYTTGYTACKSRNIGPGSSYVGRARSNYPKEHYPEGYQQLQEQYGNGYRNGWRERQAELQADYEAKQSGKKK